MSGVGVDGELGSDQLRDHEGASQHGNGGERRRSGGAPPRRRCDGSGFRCVAATPPGRGPEQEGDEEHEERQAGREAGQGGPTSATYLMSSEAATPMASPPT